MGAILLLAVGGAGVVLGWGYLRDQLRRVNEGHALAGLMGEQDRERVVSRQVSAVIEAAERDVRLGRFRALLSMHAWKGTVLRVSRGRGGAALWSFGDGSVWRVLQRSPVRLPRCVVQEAVETPDGMGVGVYVPYTYTEAVLLVEDAQELTAAAGGPTRQMAR